MLDAPPRHHPPLSASDHFARGVTKLLRFVADAFFAKRYGHRAIVLETVAAVPGMVGATLTHLHSLRRMVNDEGWIRTLMEEAENERMHLMTFIEVAKPTALERWLILFAQWVFYLGFFVLYLVSRRTAHRLVGYFEEEAVLSYTQYLAEIDAGRAPNGRTTPPCATWCWWCAPTKPTTATSTTAWPATWRVSRCATSHRRRIRSMRTRGSEAACSACQIAKQVAPERGPERAARMLLPQHGHIGERFVKDHRQQADEADDREDLQGGLEVFIALVVHRPDYGHAGRKARLPTKEARSA